MVHRGLAESLTPTPRRDADVEPLLTRAGRGIVFSRQAAERARPIIEVIPSEAPADRLLRLMQVLARLAADTDDTPIAGPAADRRQVDTPDRVRIERVLDHIHAHYRERIEVEALADAALSASGFTAFSAAIRVSP